MTSPLSVSLGDVAVGVLWGDAERTRFAFDPVYLDRAYRPVLGQHFEDRLHARVREYRGLHPWFANILPERGGVLRQRIARSLGLGLHDDLALLRALGSGLPGATRIGEHGAPPAEAAPVVAEPDPLESSLLRTSLGGMQLKFTLSGTPDRLTIPVADPAERSWILKIGGPAWPGLAENEAAVMRWCGAAGFDVPVVHVVPRDAFPELGELPRVRSGYLIERYDRTARGRVHQEDLLQVMCLPPDRRFDGTDSLGALSLAFQILGREGLIEGMRRMAAVVATGNADAHLKNWSLVYPDGVRAAWSPLYDQVSTVVFGDHERTLALRLGSARRFGDVALDHFGWVAERVAGAACRPAAREAVEETVVRLSGAFDPEALGMEPHLAGALVEHWRSVPLLRPHALGGT